jgi:hypothetical protein
LKNPFTSKTLWLNVLAIAVAVLQQLTDQQLVAPEVFATAVAVANFGLRFSTDQPLAVSANLFVPRKK